MDKPIIVVGGGIAAINAIKAIRENDQATQIILYSKEKFHPYNRIKLSKELLGNLAEDNVSLQAEKWYQENNVDLQLDSEVVDVNPDQHQVILDDQTKVDYKKLLLTTGADNLIPPIEGIDKEGVFTLRNLVDAQQIHDYAQQSEQVLIIGGGIQGLEIAWILSRAGKEVEIVEINSRLMPKELDQTAAEMLKQRVEEAGIKIHLATEISKLTGNDRVEGYQTSAGEQGNCDLVIYSTGIEPNLDLVKNTDLDRNQGIIVNQKMETSSSDIYAAGDVVEFNGRIYGLWNLAINQGKVAGYNLAGQEENYDHVIPVVTLRAFDLDLFAMGNVDQKQATNYLAEENKEAGTYSKIFIKNNVVIGAVVIGDIRKTPVLKKAIEEEIDVSSIDCQNVSVEQFLETIKNK
ncbi:NAD(P)/FAD-dependent oxidoreductase [Sporohalobacter salinus]|uniref:NAD(P)/FAD-dependent oxidoreductase n=1 Tax=Sporohalobacter salinus TaxID=1494606 RepID=UPI0019609769|nr:FAD-dependent oxidoreductase [Sporohalobacter salinus]MBM7624726.1 nitrite reductase (NADH) large subunit [Sporohalobacter salinus]